MVKRVLNQKPAGRYSPPAKKGKQRLILKNNLTTKPSSKIANSKTWKAIPYVRDGNFIKRIEQQTWSRNLKDLLATSEADMVNLLIADGLLPDWQGATCPMCSSGVLSGLQAWVSGLPRYRCGSKSCQKFVTPQHLHPIFTAARGPEGHPLGVQASVLLLRLANVPLSTIHLVLGVNHKALDRMERNLQQIRRSYVESKQQTMTFRHSKKWLDVEVDEATFDKSLVPIEDSGTPSKNMKWEQWLGIVTRGKPESLVLLRLSPKTSKPNAPGPAADWQEVAPGHQRHSPQRQRPKLQGEIPRRAA